MRAVMPPLDPSWPIFRIDELIGRCVAEKDSERPTSAILVDQLKHLNILPGSGPMIRDIAWKHLSPPPTAVRVPFWCHETYCTLCRRLLKAGGVEYVNDFDTVREYHSRQLTQEGPLPGMPPSMDMSRLASSQISSVQFLRANGERRDAAVVCVRAQAALNGTRADGKEVARRVLNGMSFEKAVALVRREKLEEVQEDSEED